MLESSVQEMKGLEIKAGGHCLGEGGGGEGVPWSGCWASSTVKPSGSWWPVVLLPFLRACCCFSVYIQTLHTNHHLLRAVTQMCSHQWQEKSAVVSAFLLVRQVLYTGDNRPWCSPGALSSILYLCQFSCAGSESIFRADERFFKYFPLVCRSFSVRCFHGTTTSCLIPSDVPWVVWLWEQGSSVLELTPASQGHRHPPGSHSKTRFVACYGTGQNESQNEAQVQ